MIEWLRRHASTAPAIIDADARVTISYGELVERVANAAEILRRENGRGLVLLAATSVPSSIVAYLACLEADCPVVLVEATPEAIQSLASSYAPAAILVPTESSLAPNGLRVISLDGSYSIALTGARDTAAIHPSLSLLLTTSGSTGSPKLVRLTRDNVTANARAIATYLGIEPSERSIQTLPTHYSYGLSLVNSHLISGATVVLTAHSFLRPEFWAAFNDSGATSFAGVPYIYETLHRLRFDPKRYPSLRTMTQAGGALRPDFTQSFYDRLHAAGRRFFVMYGQTEATARISYVPFDRLGEKIGSIGIAIPGGTLSLASVEDLDAQELVYNGPNVMMGYAESAADLASGDVLEGTLRTGDLATRDDDGFYFLTGRLKRFEKLFGRRVSLEDLERDLESKYSMPTAVIGNHGGLIVFVESAGGVNGDEIVHDLAQRLKVPPKTITVRETAALPRTAAGKKNYNALRP